jgi:hypothetical protein
MELPVNVAAYLKVVSGGRGRAGREGETNRDWSIHRDNIAFFNQQLSGLVAELADLRLGDWSTRAQLRDGLVQIAHSRILSRVACANGGRDVWVVVIAADR